jgi:hypothetical protein
VKMIWNWLTIVGVDTVKMREIEMQEKIGLK